MVTTIISGAYNNIITPSTISAFNILKVYLFWTIMHNVSNYLYQEFCKHIGGAPHVVRHDVELRKMDEK